MNEIIAKLRDLRLFPVWLKKKFDYLEKKSVTYFHSDTIRELSKLSAEITTIYAYDACQFTSETLRRDAQLIATTDKPTVSERRYDELYNVLAHADRITK